MPAAEPCRYNIEKDIAAFIKKEFDKRLVPELMRYTVQPPRSDLKGAMTLLQQCGKVLTSARLLLMLVYVCKTQIRKYNPTWHCVVGRNFGSYVTHETKHFIYFYLGQDGV